MNQLEKLLEKFINTPFPKWDDLVSLLKKLGYKQLEGDGSRVKFVNLNKQSIIELHRPHPKTQLKPTSKKTSLKN